MEVRKSFSIEWIPFEDYHFIVISDIDKIGAMLLVDRGELKHLLGSSDLYDVYGSWISEQLGMEKPLLLAFGLSHHLYKEDCIATQKESLDIMTHQLKELKKSLFSE